MGNFSLAHNRIRILIFIVALAMFLFGLRLVQVQAVQAGDYRNRAVNEMENTKSLQAPRGEITDVNGVAFARSVAATSTQQALAEVSAGTAEAGYQRTAEPHNPAPGTQQRARRPGGLCVSAA
jgi:cell division protein FtsI/penicillin-binding protein 2